MENYNDLPTEMNWMEIFRDFVKFSAQVLDDNGKEIQCKRMNSYVWASNKFDMSSPNMSNEVNLGNKKPIFFDRSLAIKGGISGITNLSYPAFIVTDRTIQYDDYFTNSPKGVINSALFFLDKSQSTNCTHNQCTSRSVKEINNDLQAMFKSLLRYIDELVYDFRDCYWVQSCLAGGNRSVGKSLYLKQRLIEENKDILGRFVSSETSKDMSGIVFNLNLPFKVCKDDQHFEYREYEQNIGLC
jgi:hypothetical protein